MTAFGGPVVQSLRAAGDDRFVFGGFPVDFDPGFVSIKDSFTRYDDSFWNTVKDSGAAVAVVSGHGGGLTLTSTATTDDDGATVISDRPVVQLTSNSRVAFEAQVKVTTASDIDLMVGLVTIPSTFTNPEAVVSENNILGFRLVDGSAVLQVQSRVAGTGNVAATDVLVADNTYVKLGMVWDGATAFMLVNRKVVATYTTVPTVVLAPVVHSLAGSNVGTKVTTIKYFFLSMTA